jgi:hypothetical protein
MASRITEMIPPFSRHAKETKIPLEGFEDMTRF